jgi:hypothetical protein
MEEHLNNIAAIIHRFKTEGRFIDAYFGLEGTVVKNISSSLELICGSETDEMTVSDVKISRMKLHEEIRKYLETNNIIHTLYITTVKSSSSWGNNGVSIYFKVEKIC